MPHNPPFQSVAPSSQNVSAKTNSPLLRKKKEKAKSNLPQRKRRNPDFSKWVERWFTDWWGSEVTSWLFGALSIGAIIITLNIHNGRPLPDWPFGITLNALISIFATIGEMAMMRPVTECISQLKWLWFRKRRPLNEFEAFDEASRGRLGSLRLAWKLRGMHLASLGAAITVIGLAFGPFTQQVLSYPSKSIAIGVTTTPQVLAYLTEKVIEGINPELYSAMTLGLSTTGTNLSNVSAACDTGNCTWPLYTSLGMCASVVDISEYLIEQPCDTLIYNYFVSSWESQGDVFALPCFNYSLQQYEGDGIPFTFLGNQTTLDTTESVSQNTNLYASGDVLGVPGNRTTNGTALDFYIMHQPLLNSSQNSSLTNAIALECKLAFCAQTYQTSANASNTTTSLIATEYLMPDAEGLNINAVVNGFNFSVDAHTAGLFNYFAQPTFNGYCDAYQVGLENGQPTPPGWPVNQPFVCTSYAAEAFGLAFNATLNQGDTAEVKSVVETIMNNLAISLTNEMRQGAGGATTVVPFQGTAWAMENYVKAQYLWLTLPIGLVFLTLILLIATISKSCRAKTEIWKSSSLATLQGLNHVLHGQLGGLHTMDEVKALAEGLEVRIEMDKNGKGWSLVRL